METEAATELNVDIEPPIFGWDIPDNDSQDPPQYPRLYNCPPLIKGEANSAWIYRIAARYGWSPRTICQLVGIEYDPVLLDFSLTKSDRHRISETTGASVPTLTSRLAYGASKLPLRYLLILTTSDGRYPHCRCCAQCLLEDEIPYIRLHWRMVTTIICEKHLAPLVEYCPSCAYGIQLEFRNPEILTIPNRDLALRYCPRCGQIVKSAISHGVSPRLAQALVRFQQITNQVISHGQYHHPIYGPLSRELFLDIFFEIKLDPNLTLEHSRNKWLQKLSSRTTATYISINWDAVVHPRDSEEFSRIFCRLANVRLGSILYLI